ncbi:Cell division protein FtsA [Buchnera aphidicola (Eriosoma grossulariae)]|uniref:cell division protein FtsA n=1 Tax=Buchnera aphidicola TaxID=9 RepID=UPI0034641A14
MIQSAEKKIIVGLDIGTTKISTLIGEILLDGTINIIGVGNCLSRGMHNGTINDLESITKCIKKSIHQAEIMSKTHVSSIYLAFSNKDIHCQNEIGMIPIRHKEVTKNDINHVIYTAKSVKIYHEHHILHVIPQEYEIDHQIEIKNPIGLSGMRMKAHVHLITCHKTTKNNIIKSINQCGIKVNQLIFSGLASSQSVLNNEEKESGVCLIDMGGGTLDITVYIAGILQHSQVIPYAGNIITNDIAYALSTSQTNAENIKTIHGIENSLMIENSEHIEVMNISGINTQKFKKSILNEVIELRCCELFNIVNNEIIAIQKKLKENGKKYQILSGIVLTGGSAKLKSLKMCAEKIFKKKVRIGLPHPIPGLINNFNDPNYSTVIGLLYYGKKHYIQKQQKKINKKNYFQIWLKKINYWIQKKK